MNFSSWEYRTISLWIVTGVFALIFFVLSYDLSNPEASLDLSLTRSDAVVRAREYIETQGVDLSEYRHAVIFHTRRNTKDFLEKELSLSEANRLMRDEVSTWQWGVRWFIPMQQEEYSVWFSPSGELVSYLHTISEDASGADVSEERAQEIAENFLKGIEHIALADYKLIANIREERPNRIDHDFIWEREDFNYKDATYRVRVRVAGDNVDLFGEGLKIPENWHRDMRFKLAQRRLIVQVARAFHNLLWIIAVAVFYFRIKEHDLHFRFSIILGLIMFCVPFLSWLNGLSMSWMGYATTDSVSAFFGQQLIGLFAGMWTIPLMMAVLMPAADSLSREVFPRHLPISRIFTRTFWCSKPLFTAAIIGICLAMLHAGYVNGFYIIGKYFDVWSPQSTPHQNALATPIPWIYPLTTGLMAALNEEFMYRLLAITLLMRITKRRSVSIIVPAVVWAFLHANYPQEPVYIRGVEITVIGIVYGMVFLRYGIMASIISHFTFNALVSSIFLLRSGNTYFQASGVIVVCLMFLPILPGMWMLLRGRRLVPIDNILTAQFHPINLTHVFGKPAVIETPQYAKFKLMSMRQLSTIGLLATVGLLAYFIIPVGEKFGDYVQIKVNRSEARTSADYYLTQRGISVDQYKKNILFYSGLNSDDADYIWQHSGLSELNRLYKKYFPIRPGWYVRYFRPLEKESHTVYIDSSGKVFRYYHVLPEEAPGASLSIEEAQKIAEEFLFLDAESMNLVDSHTVERPARNDHSFIWEDTTETVGEGSFRVKVIVQGDEPQGPEHLFKIPEEWSRKRAEHGLGDTIATGLAIIIGVSVSSFIGFHLLVLLFRHAIRFRQALYFGLVIFILEEISAINKLCSFWNSYSTTSPPEVFIAHRILILFIMQPIAYFAAGFCLAALADVLFRYAFPDCLPLTKWFNIFRIRSIAEIERLPLRRAWGQAILISCCLALMYVWTGNMGQFKSPDKMYIYNGGSSIHDSAPEAKLHSGHVSIFPSAMTLFDSLQKSVLIILSSVILCSIVYKYFFGPRRIALLCFTICMLMPLRVANNLADGLLIFAQNSIICLAIFLVLYLLVRYVVRDNLPAYLLMGVMDELLSDGLEMLSASDSVSRMHGTILISLFCLSIVVGLYLSFSGMKGQEDCVCNGYE